MKSEELVIKQMPACLERDGGRLTRTGREKKQSSFWELLNPFHFGRVGRFCSLTRSLIRGEQWTNCREMSSASSFFFFGWGGSVGLFGIYLKIEQAHSGFHKGHQADGLRQRPSFQVVLKPANELSTRGPRQARLINSTETTVKLRAITAQPFAPATPTAAGITFITGPCFGSRVLSAVKYKIKIRFPHKLESIGVVLYKVPYIHIKVSVFHTYTQSIKIHCSLYK